MVKQIDPNRPVYSIGVTADLIGVKPQTLRIYEENGIVKPSRTEKNRRLYSNNDVERLEYVHFLTHVKKVGIPGVKVILEILDMMTDEQRQGLIDVARQEMESLSQRKASAEAKEEAVKA